MERYIGEYNSGVSRIEIFLIGIYIFLSTFETYLIPFIGNVTKYYLIFLLGFFLYNEHLKVQISCYWIYFLLWFFLKFVSIGWATFSWASNSDFYSHIISQIGMMLFVVIMTGCQQSGQYLHKILQLLMWTSFAYGILSIRYSSAYRSEAFAARQVLTLFGQQLDPNNCAAFLMIGVTLGLYSAVVDRRMVLISGLITAVNAYALLLTSSRGGFLTLGIVTLLIIFVPPSGKRFHFNSTAIKFFVLCIIICIIYYVAITYLPQDNLKRLLNFDEYENGSGRAEKWKKAFILIAQRPLLGWGWGGYYLDGGVVHNTYLTMLCDVGICGTILFFIPIFMIFLDAIKQKNVLPVLLLLTGLFPAMTIDAINKRFFWNAIVFSSMLVVYGTGNSECIHVWNRSKLLKVGNGSI